MRGYDYSLPGAYFITICAHENRCVFGRVPTLDGAGQADVEYSPLGKIAFERLQDLERHYTNVRVDNWVIMPNHVHLLISITRQIPDVPSVSYCIPNVIGKFKVSVTREARKARLFSGALWQKSYHDHIVRGEEDYRAIWNYITGNPSKWQEDRFFRSEG